LNNKKINVFTKDKNELNVQCIKEETNSYDESKNQEKSFDLRRKSLTGSNENDQSSKANKIILPL